MRHVRGGEVCVHGGQEETGGGRDQDEGRIRTAGQGDYEPDRKTGSAFFSLEDFDSNTFEVS